MKNRLNKTKIWEKQELPDEKLGLQNKSKNFILSMTSGSKKKDVAEKMNSGVLKNFNSYFLGQLKYYILVAIK